MNRRVALCVCLIGSIAGCSKDKDTGAAPPASVNPGAVTPQTPTGQQPSAGKPNPAPPATPGTAADTGKTLDEEIKATGAGVTLKKLDLTPHGLPVLLDAPEGAVVKEDYDEVIVYAGKGFCMKLKMGFGSFPSARKDLVDGAARPHLKDHTKLLANTDELVVSDIRLPGREYCEFAQKKALGDQAVTVTGHTAFTHQGKMDTTLPTRAVCMLMVKCIQAMTVKPVPADPAEALKLYKVEIATWGDGPGLKVICEEKCKATDDCLRHVTKLPNVQYVGLSNGVFTDAAMEHIGKVKTLQTLSLRECQVTDAGLKSLVDLPELVALSISQDTISKNGVTGSGFTHLATLPKLNSLSLFRCPLEDGHLAFLEKCTSLKRLSIAETPITDGALEHLKKLKKLKRIEISGRKLTPAGLDHLKKALPNTEFGR